MYPRFGGVGLLGCHADAPRERPACAGDTHPSSAGSVLDLLKADRKVAQIAADLGVTAQTIYTWQKQELIDTGHIPGPVQYR